MKRKGNLIGKIAELDNLYLAYTKACRGKRGKRVVLEFEQNFDDNISQLQKEILSGNVDVGHFTHFRIYDPKPRLISAPAFKERVLHHAIMNICDEYFDKTLLETIYASRKGKGVYAAIEKAIKEMPRYQWSAKLDYRKYYDSIDHNVLKTQLRKKYKDKILLAIFDRIIDSYSVNPDKGLPIGNLTSQYFANFYLSELDHLAKHQLKIPVYIRYMDDILILGCSRDFLRQACRELAVLSEQKLYLRLKPAIINLSKNGQNFLGYKVYPHRYYLSGRSKRRFRTKYLRYEKLYETSVWNEQQLVNHLIPLLAFTQHSVSGKFRKSCIGNCRKRV